MKKRKATNSAVQEKQSLVIMNQLNRFTDWLNSLDINLVPFDRKSVQLAGNLNHVNNNCIMMFDCPSDTYTENDLCFGICLTPTGVELCMYPTSSDAFCFHTPTTSFGVLCEYMLKHYCDTLKRWSNEKPVVCSTTTKYKSLSGKSVVTQGPERSHVLLCLAEQQGLIKTVSKQTLITETIVEW